MPALWRLGSPTSRRGLVSQLANPCDFLVIPEIQKGAREKVVVDHLIISVLGDRLEQGTCRRPIAKGHSGTGSKAGRFEAHNPLTFEHRRQIRIGGQGLSPVVLREGIPQSLNERVTDCLLLVGRQIVPPCSIFLYLNRMTN